MKGRGLNRLTMGPYKILVAVGGLEPPTSRVWAERYNQLSYTAITLSIIISILAFVNNKIKNFQKYSVLFLCLQSV